MAKGKKTGGRQPGTPNKAKGDAKAIALAMVPEATERLRELLMSDNETIRKGAVELIYAYAFGRPSQSHTVGNAPGEKLEHKHSFKVEFVGAK